MAHRPPQQPPPEQRPRRLLALDPGSRRTGVAVSDSLGMYAHTRPAIMLDGRTSLVEAVARLVEAEDVDEVVVGVALSMSGADSAQTAEARVLIAKLRQRLSVRVTEWDERLSSTEAAKADPRAARKRTGELDSLAAAIVLQAVLDSRRGARV